MNYFNEIVPEMDEDVEKIEKEPQTHNIPFHNVSAS